MLKHYKLIGILVLGVTFSSCDKLSSLLPNFENSKSHQSLSVIDFGKLEHYQPFLWKEGNAANLDATLVTEFNEASAKAGSFIVLEVQDEEGQVISEEDIQISINGTSIKGGHYKLVGSNKNAQQELNISLSFANREEAKDFKGFFTVKQSNLDRVNDTPLDNAANGKILQWRAEYKPVINPLKKWLLITSLLLAFLLLIRLTILKRKFHPVFSGTIRYLESPTQSRSINFNGNRQVVLTNRVPKQSNFDKIWRGRILYINDPSITTPIELTPKKKGVIRYRLDSNKYAITPADGFLQKGIEYKIKSTESKQTVILK